MPLYFHQLSLTIPDFVQTYTMIWTIILLYVNISRVSQGRHGCVVPPCLPLTPCAPALPAPDSPAPNVLHSLYVWLIQFGAVLVEDVFLLGLASS